MATNAPKTQIDYINHHVISGGIAMNMKMTHGTGWSAVSCQICVDTNVRVENHLKTALEPDTICYARCV